MVNPISSHLWEFCAEAEKHVRYPKLTDQYEVIFVASTNQIAKGFVPWPFPCVSVLETVPEILI